MNHLSGRAASVLTGLATAIVIVAVTIIPFLSPQWVALTSRAQAAAWTGPTGDEPRVVTDAILPISCSVAISRSRSTASRSCWRGGVGRHVRTVFRGILARVWSRLSL